jgi:hypothetical protein
LHIGLPKTGTTAIQKWCFQNTDYLRENRSEYPRSDLPHADPKHSFILTELLNGKFQRISDALKNDHCERIIFSNEALSIFLSEIKKESIDRLIREAKGRDIAIVLSLRTDDDWAASLYKQSIINPNRNSPINAIGKDFEEFLRIPRIKELLDHDFLIKSISEKFKTKRILLMVDSKDSVTDFLSTIGIPPSKEIVRAEHNSSLPNSLIPLISKINSTITSEGERFAWIALVLTALNVNNINLAYYRAQLYNPENFRSINSAVKNGFLNEISTADRLKIEKTLSGFGNETYRDVRSRL